MPILPHAEFVAISILMFAGLFRYIRRDQSGISWLPLLLLALVLLLAGQDL
jgi:hypothetical protein